MRVVVLSTSTPDCEKLWRSLGPVHEVIIIRYDVPGVDVIQTTLDAHPDFVVYIGAATYEFHSGARTPTPEQLARVNAVVPMVHLCSDAAEPSWQPFLAAYAAAKSFSLQIAIDGVRGVPHIDMTALTPIDGGQFVPLPWVERDIACGFAGNGRRTGIINQIRACGAPIEWPNAGGEMTYREYCSFLSRCRLVFNDARMGSGACHVKGRVVETGLAGAIVLEIKDSPLRDWFVPGEDFLEWGSPEEAAGIIKREDYDPMVATRFREKVLREHSAGIFWQRVMERINL